MLPWKSKLNGPPEQCQSKCAPVRGRTGGKEHTGPQLCISQSHGKHQNSLTEIPQDESVPSGAAPSFTQGCVLPTKPAKDTDLGVYCSQPNGNAPSRDGVSSAALGSHTSTSYSRRNARPLERRKGSCLSEIPPIDQQVPGSNNTKTLQRLHFCRKSPSEKPSTSDLLPVRDAKVWGKSSNYWEKVVQDGTNSRWKKQKFHPVLLKPKSLCAYACCKEISLGLRDWMFQWTSFTPRKDSKAGLTWDDYQNLQGVLFLWLCGRIQDCFSQQKKLTV